MLALIAHSPHMLSRAELQRELSRSREAEPFDVDTAVADLRAAGLVNVSGELVGASRAARYMDEMLGCPG